MSNEHSCQGCATHTVCPCRTDVRKHPPRTSETGVDRGPVSGDHPWAARPLAALPLVSYVSIVRAPSRSPTEGYVRRSSITLEQQCIHFVQEPCLDLKALQNNDPV